MVRHAPPLAETPPLSHPSRAVTAPAIAAWTTHGGRLQAACATFGGVVGDWLDLSTGISPHAWPGASSAPIDWRALPDPEALARLEGVAAAHIGAARCCAVPGSELALRLLDTVLAGPAAYVAPGYRTHAEAFPDGIAIDADEIEAAARAGRVVVLANPGNPDGTVVAAARLLDVAAVAKRHGGWLVVDEAFADATDVQGLASHVDDLPIIVLRSFGKFFGLAGVRLGFVAAPPALLAAIRARLGGWPVSAAAIAIGTAAYADARWIADMRRRLAADARDMDAVLAAHGLAPAGACPLFRLAATPDADRLFGRLAERRILVRPFADRPDRLRFGLPGGAEALARLDAALRDG